MSSKIKAVDIEDTVAEEEPKAEAVEDPRIEETREEEPEKVETPKSETDEIKEIIDEASVKPKPTRKMVTCPDCSKTMLEKNFRYQHLSVCGKVKTPKLRAKPIEEVIKEKQEKTQPKPKPNPIEQLPPPPPPSPPDYWELRRQYNNHLNDRKTQLVKKLVSKAF